MKQIINKLVIKGYDEIKVTEYIQFCIEHNQKEHTPFETENHHILPKEFFGKYSDLNKFKWNSSILSIENHYKAHYMLANIDRTLSLGWFYMNNKAKDVPMNNIVKENYVRLRKEAVKLISIKNTGRKRTEEQKENLRIASSKKDWASIGKKVSLSKTSMYKIYDNLDVLRFETQGSLQKFLLTKNLPFAFMNSYKKFGKPLYLSKASKNASKVEDVERFEGWYCVKDNNKSKEYVINNSVGSKSYNYIIYNSDGKEIFYIDYGLERFCKDHDLPFQQLRKSLKTGCCLYENLPANVLSKVSKNKHYKLYNGFKIIRKD